MEHTVYPAWEELPDFGLYMDQLMTCVSRTLKQGGELTAGMINSYVKAGLIDRPAGKKYSRDSLAQLLMVCSLKQATPLEAIGRLIHREGETAESLYNRFREEQRRLAENVDREKNLTAMDCAIVAAMFQSRCMKLLQEPAGSEP